MKAKKLILAITICLASLTGYSQYFLDLPVDSAYKEAPMLIEINDSTLYMSDSVLEIRLLIKNDIVISEQYITNHIDDFKMFSEYIYYDFILLHEEDDGTKYYKHAKVNVYCSVNGKIFTFR